MALRDGLIVEPIQLAPADEVGKLDFTAVFGNANPVELEIGSGKGTFLLALAQAKRETNFIGIEYAKAYADFAADRLRRHGLLNCRIVPSEASWFLRCHVPDASLQALHIYFPDPWPKTRHHKRRLIQVPFMKEVHRILVPGGKLRLVTDHVDYFAHMQQVLAEQKYLTVIPFDSALTGEILAPAGGAVVDVSKESGSIVGTNFEKKYVAEGRSFHAAAAMKAG